MSYPSKVSIEPRERPNKKCRCGERLQACCGFFDQSGAFCCFCSGGAPQGWRTTAETAPAWTPSTTVWLPAGAIVLAPPEPVTMKLETSAEAWRSYHDEPHPLDQYADRLRAPLSRTHLLTEKKDP